MSSGLSLLTPPLFASQALRLLTVEAIQREIAADLADGCTCSCDAQSTDLLALYESSPPEQQHIMERTVQVLGGRSLIIMTNAVAWAAAQLGDDLNLEGNPSLRDQPTVWPKVLRYLNEQSPVTVTLRNFVHSLGDIAFGQPDEVTLTTTDGGPDWNTVGMLFHDTCPLYQLQHDMYGVCCLVDGHPAGAEYQLRGGEEVEFHAAPGYHFDPRLSRMVREARPDTG